MKNRKETGQKIQHYRLQQLKRDFMEAIDLANDDHLIQAIHCQKVYEISNDSH